MALRKPRASDNGDLTKYKRSFFGGIQDVVKLLVFSGIIGGSGSVVYWNQQAPRAFTNEQEAVFHSRMEGHLDKIGLHENSDQKTKRIREVLDREYVSTISVLADKIDVLSTRISEMERSIRGLNR